jgi:hypothetical protein
LNGTSHHEELAMKLYFLALATLLIVCVGCAYDGQQTLHRNEYNAPPAAMMAHPGPMVTGPGPAVMGPYAMGSMGAPVPPPGMPGMPMGGMPMGGMAPQGPPQNTQVRFLGPEGTSIGWQIGEAFAENQLMAPASYNFPQGATYRLKLSAIPGREMPPIYPTLHVYPVQPATEAYLSHNAVPLRINDEDLDQVSTSNFVTKVIYLPDAKFQELAIAGVEELVSTRLPQGQDPIQEADRRGTVMVVLRMGNMDLEMPGMMTEEGVEQTSFQAADGDKDGFVAPVPIASFSSCGSGVPGDVLAAGPTMTACGPGGIAPGPVWGYPTVGTPIGLPGPPHIPLGNPASLKSHTMRNLTDVDLGKPVEHMLIDVRHEPGLSLPHPVNHVQYTEKHPVYSPGEVSMPAGGYGQGAYCPPQ